MKKVLYAIFSIAIFTAFSLNVKAEFNYDSCTNICAYYNSKGSLEYNKCMAGCDANKFIEERKNTCSNNQSCLDKWQSSFTTKYDYYLEYYNNTPSSGNYYNYSRFDYDTCGKSCSGAIDLDACEADCAARDEIKECIIDAYSKEMVENCKNKYTTIYQDKLNEYNGGNSEDTNNNLGFNYNVCKSKCDSSDHECESDCYAQEKVQECIKDCGNGHCDCESSYGYYYNQRLNTYNPYSKVQCGELEVPYLIPQVVRTIIVILQIATPIIIIILGSLDLVKAVMAQKEDEIKKGQKTFIRRLMVGALVFLVFVIVELVIGLVAPKKDNYNMWNCVDCFVNGDCQTK